MLGALAELVHVDEGYEAAFEAAAGEALSAVLMEGEQAAPRASPTLQARERPALSSRSLRLPRLPRQDRRRLGPPGLDRPERAPPGSAYTHSLGTRR